MTEPTTTGGASAAGLKMIAGTMPMALIMLAIVMGFALEPEPDGDPMLGWILAVAAPVVSLVLARVASTRTVQVSEPSGLYQAYVSSFFMTMAMAEGPGLLLVAAGFVMGLSSVQVASGLVLTAVVVWFTVRPTRQRAENFAYRALGAGADVRAFVEQF